MQNLPLTKKLLLVVALVAVGMGIIFAVSLFKLHEELMDSRQQKTRSIVEASISTIDYFQEQAQAGQMSVEEAQGLAQKAISKTRYDGSDYVWINDMKANMVMHPISPELNGKDMSSTKDPNGLNIFVAFVEMVRDNKAGFVPYMWPKPGAKKPQPKVSYVQGYEPWGWVVGTGVYVDDVNDEFINQTLVFVGIFVVILGAVLAVSMYVSRNISKPIQALSDCMMAISEGNKSLEIPGMDRGDEVGGMAHAVDIFKEKMIHADEMDEKEERERKERERAAHIKVITHEFDVNAADMIGLVSSAATELQSLAQSMTSTADHTKGLAATVASSSEEASANVQTVASAAEELSSSISEISRQVAQSTQIATNAVEEVNSANTQVQGLADAAHKIGEVVALITDIADQTNLLALNATIEAARAGEAGKGFAVVASEVKNLANQTAKATEEISSQIGGIQGATRDAVHAIGSIGGTIREMSEIASAIAAAVEEQGAATQEIARNVEQAAQGTQDVSTNIVQVTQSTDETEHSAEEVLSASSELSQQAEQLRTTVTTFLEDFRSA